MCLYIVLDPHHFSCQEMSNKLLQCTCNGTHFPDKFIIYYSRSIGFSSSPIYSTTDRKTQILHLDNKSVIVAASPITEDAVVATKPLTKQDLVGHLASGCKPKEKWR